MTPWNAYLFCRATGLGRLKSLAVVARWLVYLAGS